jgi:hypothetical protein
VIKKKILNAEKSAEKALGINKQKSKKRPVVDLTKALPKKNTKKTAAKKKTVSKKSS